MLDSMQASLGSMVSGQNMPTQNVTISDRVVSFTIFCAPLDRPNPMYAFVHHQDWSLLGVTDSASYLTRMPFVVVDADTKKVIYPLANSHKEYDQIRSVSSTNSLHDGQRKVHALPAIRVPENVRRIALHIGNDAYKHNRNFQLFPWVVPDVAHSKVSIYEIRSDLQGKFQIDNQLPSVPSENSIGVKNAASSEYFGFLNGDLWLRISREFTDGDIARLCPPETLSRTPLAGNTQASPQSAGSLQAIPPQQNIPVGMAPHAEGPHAYMGPVAGGASNAGSASVVQPHITGNVEQVSIDWLATLAPIYAAGHGSRSMAPFTVVISNLDITLTFIARSLANAVNTSERTTIQQALRRTSPRTFAALLKAAWRLNIDKLSLSSSWRPMLGSRLHKMGVGLDVTEIDDSAEHIDFTIHNHSHADRGHPFPTSAGGQKIARLYQELNGASEVMHGAVYTPWVNWVEPHDTHMHITVKDE